jgi:hypothetical protein
VKQKKLAAFGERGFTEYFRFGETVVPHCVLMAVFCLCLYRGFE